MGNEHVTDNQLKNSVFTAFGILQEIVWNRIKKMCSEIGERVNEYLYMLVCNDLADGISRMAEKKQGYFIYLKNGYVNDVNLFLNLSGDYAIL
jgi:hypothetical protein